MRTILLLVYAATPIVELLGSLSERSTYITVIYQVLTLLLAIFVVRDTAMYQSCLRAAILPALYAITFIIVSYYGANFEYSIKYRVLLLPLLVVDFCMFYIIAYAMPFQLVMRAIGILITVFAILSLLLAHFDITDASMTRVIYGFDLPFAVPPMIMFGSLYLGGILVFVALLSVKKTVFLSCIAAFLATYAIRSALRVGIWKRRRTQVQSEKVKLLTVPKLAGLGASCVILGLFFYTYLSETIVRLLTERQDIYRSEMAGEFMRLSREHFPGGIGYYCFGFLTKDTIKYYSQTASGMILDDGMSLHNSFMHVILEGGGAVCIVLALLCWLCLKRIRSMAKDPEQKGFAVVFIGWAIAAAIFGSPQPFHATHYFFGIPGLIMGTYDRYQRKRAEAVNCSCKNIKAPKMATWGLRRRINS